VAVSVNPRALNLKEVRAQDRIRRNITDALRRMHKQVLATTKANPEYGFLDACDLDALVTNSLLSFVAEVALEHQRTKHKEDETPDFILVTSLANALAHAFSELQADLSVPKEEYDS
jgi:hypothetical protein